MSRLAGQEGLYVGLGLGAVTSASLSTSLGRLLATQDIKTTLVKAHDLIKLVEGLASGLPEENNAIIEMP